MTALIATEPEPAGDIAAQLAALVDPDHPKRAVWISVGTEFVIVDGVSCADLPGRGTLYASEHDCGRLEDDPSLETLAEILDYDEPKPSQVTSELPVVQAVDADGWVVQEMVSSWSRIGEARRRAAAYGAVRVLSMAACIARRRRLIGTDKERVRA